MNNNCFTPGEVWINNTKKIWRVIRYDYRKSDKRVLMRSGIKGEGRTLYRAWDSIDGWRLYMGIGDPPPTYKRYQPKPKKVTACQK